MTDFPQHFPQRERLREAWAICFGLGFSSTKGCPHLSLDFVVNMPIQDQKKNS